MSSVVKAVFLFTLTNDALHRKGRWHEWCTGWRKQVLPTIVLCFFLKSSEPGDTLRRNFRQVMSCPNKMPIKLIELLKWWRQLHRLLCLSFLRVGIIKCLAALEMLQKTDAAVFISHSVFFTVNLHHASKSIKNLTSRQKLEHFWRKGRKSISTSSVVKGLFISRRCQIATGHRPQICESP